MPDCTEEARTPTGPRPGVTPGAQTPGGAAGSREGSTRRPEPPTVSAGQDPAHRAPLGPGGEDRGPSIPTRRSTARARPRTREPVDFGRWDGLSADEIHP